MTKEIENAIETLRQADRVLRELQKTHTKELEGRFSRNSSIKVMERTLRTKLRGAEGRLIKAVLSADEETSDTQRSVTITIKELPEDGVSTVVNFYPPSFLRHDTDNPTSYNTVVDYLVDTLQRFSEAAEDSIASITTDKDEDVELFRKGERFK